MAVNKFFDSQYRKEIVYLNSLIRGIAAFNSPNDWTDRLIDKAILTLSKMYKKKL